MSTNVNPNENTIPLPSTCPPLKPVRQRGFYRQSDEKWAVQTDKYETDLIAWRRGLNPALTTAAENGTLTAQMILAAVETEIDLVKHGTDGWRDNHPSALWCMENQESFGSLPPNERVQVVLSFVADTNWVGAIGEQMISNFPEIFLLIDDVKARWVIIQTAVSRQPSYDKWSWVKHLSEHHDHAHLRKVVLNLVKTLPVHYDSKVSGNRQHATQAITCQNWGIYEGNLEAFLEMLTVLTQRVPALILDWWYTLVIEIGKLAGYRQRGGKKMNCLHGEAMRLAEMGGVFQEQAEEMENIQTRNNSRAYKLGMEHAQDLFQTLLEHLTVINSVNDICRFPLDIQMRILRQVEHNDTWLSMLIDLIYKLGENHEHLDELQDELFQALYATDRPDKFYRKVADHCPDKKLWSGHRCYNGFKGTWFDILLRRDLQLLGWGFYTVTYRQPKRRTRSYHKRSYDGLQVVFYDKELGKQMVLKVLPVGFDWYDQKGKDVFRRGVEVIVPLRPNEKHLVYENDRTRIYADVTVLRSLREYDHDMDADDFR